MKTKMITTIMITLFLASILSSAFNIALAQPAGGVEDGGPAGGVEDGGPEGGATPPTADFTYSPLSPNEGSVVSFTDASTDVDGGPAGGVEDGGPAGGVEDGGPAGGVEDGGPAGGVEDGGPEGGATDGIVVSWSWSFGDGGTSTLQNPTHVFGDNGVYTVSLTVTDDDGLTDTKTTDVTVNNVDPTADAGPDQMVDEGSTAYFSGTFTDPGTEDTHTIVWYFGDGSTTTGTLTPTHVYADDGVYAVALVVTDDEGGTGMGTLTVFVFNVAPGVDAGPDQTVTAGDTVYFSGSFTDPGLLDTHTYSWDCGDGTVVTDTLTPTHVYPDAGVYTVYLQVTDDDGGVGTDTLVVTVNPIPATININPDTLKSKSKGKWITCYIELPEGYDVYDIDLSSIKLWYDGGFVSAESDPKYGFVTDPSVYITDVDGDGILERMVKFDRSEVITLLGGALGDVIFTVTGKIAGADFSGADTIRVI